MLVDVTRVDPVTAARQVVMARFPHARQAWLSGSVVLGGATETSDLDITVLLGEAEVHRESLMHGDWPVELFVHTESSIQHFVAKDVARRRPTMARLVSTGLPLISGDAGAQVRQACADAISAGPGPLPADEMELARYTLTDQLDDLEGATPGPTWDAIVIEVWRGTAELLLAACEWWSGTSKWLIREVESLDETMATNYAPRLHASLRAAIIGDPRQLIKLADEVLGRVGGRVWDGFYLSAPSPPNP